MEEAAAVNLVILEAAALVAIFHQHKQYFQALVKLPLLDLQVMMKFVILELLGMFQIVMMILVEMLDYTGLNYILLLMRRMMHKEFIWLLVIQF